MVGRLLVTVKTAIARSMRACTATLAACILYTDNNFEGYKRLLPCSKAIQNGNKYLQP